MNTSKKPACFPYSLHASTFYVFQVKTSCPKNTNIFLPKQLIIEQTRYSFSASSFVGRENFEVIKKEPIILLFVSKDNGIRYPIRIINLNLYIKIISQLYFKTLRYITTHQQFCF